MGVLGFCVLIPAAIAQFVLCKRLLQLNGTLHGLLKPLAYIGMTISVCALTLIFVFVGMFLAPVYATLLGIILIKGPEQPEIPEFV